MSKILQLFLLFFLSFLIVSISLKKHEAEKYKKKHQHYLIANESFFRKVLKKFKVVRAKEEYLFKQGNPLKLNSINYYILKGSIAFLFFLSASINYGNFFATLFFTITGYFLLDFYLFFNQKNRDAQIREDLLHVSNAISLQLSANIMLKDSLKKQFEICKNKDFKSAMLRLSTKYELTEFDMEIALRELKNSFAIKEMEMFCNCLTEYNHIGNIIELLENFSEMMKHQYLKKIRDATNAKILYITFGVVIALGNMILITFYPLFVSLSQNFHTIFQ